MGDTVCVPGTTCIVSFHLHANLFQYLTTCFYSTPTRISLRVIVEDLPLSNPRGLPKISAGVPVPAVKDEYLAPRFPATV